MEMCGEDCPHFITQVYLGTSGGDYTDPGVDYYEQRYRDRLLHKLQKKAQAFGFELVAHSLLHTVS